MVCRCPLSANEPAVGDVVQQASVADAIPSISKMPLCPVRRSASSTCELISWSESIAYRSSRSLAVARLRESPPEWPVGAIRAGLATSCRSYPTNSPPLGWSGQDARAPPIEYGQTNQLVCAKEPKNDEGSRPIFARTLPPHRPYCPPEGLLRRQVGQVVVEVAEKFSGEELTG